MSEEKRHSGYSATDIRRYFTGGMTAAEMHALESAAARDPFLAEALEGYGSMPPENWTPALERLHAHFTSKKQPARFTLPYMRAAAGISLLAITIAVAYLVTRRETASPGELAVNTPAATEQLQVPLPSDTTAAVSSATSPAAETAPPAHPAPPAAAANDITALRETAADSSFVYRPAPPAVTGPPATLPPPAATDDPTTIAARQETEEKSIKEYTGNAVINETAAVNAGNNQAQPGVAEGNVNRQAENNRAKSVTAADPSKKFTRDKAMADATVPSAARPAVGWDQYRLYLQKEKRNPEIIRNRQLHGDVLLTLHLLADGRIRKIEISRSLHPDCDAEAVRLIREGPAWEITPGHTSAVVQVIVNF